MMIKKKIPSDQRAETFRYMCKVIDDQSQEAKLARREAVLDRFPHTSRTEARRAIRSISCVVFGSWAELLQASEINHDCETALAALMD